MAPHDVVYQFGEFHLDRDERVLRRAITVPLTPKATEILLALIDEHGHIVEKTDLMQHVWSDTAVEDGNLSQNIYTLRRVSATRMERVRSSSGPPPRLPIRRRRPHRQSRHRVARDRTDDQCRSADAGGRPGASRDIGGWDPRASIPRIDRAAPQAGATGLSSARGGWWRILGTGLLGGVTSWLMWDRFPGCGARRGHSADPGHVPRQCGARRSLATVDRSPTPHDGIAREPLDQEARLGQSDSIDRGCRGHVSARRRPFDWTRLGLLQLVQTDLPAVGIFRHSPPRGAPSPCRMSGICPPSIRRSTIRLHHDHVDADGEADCSFMGPTVNRRGSSPCAHRP